MSNFATALRRRLLTLLFVILGSAIGAPAVLADALERIAAKRGELDFEAHPAGVFIEYGRPILDLLADFGAARVAHASSNDIRERQAVLFEP